MSLCVSLLLAAMTNVVIERPLRSFRILAKPRELLLGASACATLVVSIAALYLGTSGATYRYPLAVRHLFDASNDKVMRRCPLLFQVFHPLAKICPITQSHGQASVLLLGDSHADQLLPQLTSLAEKYFISVYYENTSRCMPGHVGLNQWCTDAAFRKIIEEARLNNIGEIIVVSTWSAANNDGTPVFTNNIDLAINQGMRVTILEQVPHHQDFDPTIRADGALRSGRLSLAGIPASIHQQQMEQTRAFFRQLVVERASSIDIINPTSALCDAGVCDFHTDGKPNYFDDNHLTQVGVHRIIRLFDPVFRRISNPRASN